MTEKDLGQIIPDILATATVDNKVGEPAVNVTVEQINEVNRLERKFNFEFVNMKGEKGDTPVKGVDYLTEEEKQQFTAETLSLVTAEGAKQVKAVTDKASEQISKVSSQGNDQISLVSAEGQKVVEQVKKLIGVNPAGGDAVSVGGKTRVEFEKDTQALAGKYNGNFPLTSAVKDAVYLVPTTGKFYICNESYSGKSLSEPNENFEELSVFKIREKLDNLKLKKNSVVRECIADGAINDEKIEKHSISHKSLNKDIVSLIFADGENMLNPNTMTPNARLKRDGSIETFENSSYTISDYIYVAPYDTITVDHRKTGIISDYLGCWYDSNKKYIRAVEYTDYSFSDTKKDIITIPSNAAYMRRTFWLNPQKAVLAGSVENFEIKEYIGIKEFTDDNFKIKEEQLIYSSQNQRGVYLKGNGSTYQYIHTPLRVYLDVEQIAKNDKIKIEVDLSTDNNNVKGLGYALGGVQSYKLYTKHNQIETITHEIIAQKELTGKKNTWLILGLYHTTKATIGDGILSNIRITINDMPVTISSYFPEKTYGFMRYIQVAFNKLDYKTRVILDSLDLNGITQDSWKDIKWVTVGDSITEVNFRTLKNYHKLISELTGIQVTNKGSSGTGYWGPTDGAGFFNQLSSINDGEFDIITIFGSPNDRYRYLTKKGTITDNLDGEELKPTSYCGQVNQCYNLISKKFIKTKVIVIGPLPTSYDNYHDELLNKPQKNPIGGEGYCMREMDEILEKLCAIWNIPYLSLFKKGLLKPWVTEQNTAFFKQDGVGRPSYNPDAEPDGLHPNTAGHMMIVPVILNFLKEHIAIETQFEKTGDENFYIPE